MEPIDALKTASACEEVDRELFQRATDLAYQAFGEEASDDHIEWAYHRVSMHWTWGLPMDSVVTVH